LGLRIFIYQRYEQKRRPPSDARLKRWVPLLIDSLKGHPNLRAVEVSRVILQYYLSPLLEEEHVDVQRLGEPSINDAASFWLQFSASAANLSLEAVVMLLDVTKYVRLIFLSLTARELLFSEVRATTACKAKQEFYKR
jgi:hypothetical protein